MNKKNMIFALIMSVFASSSVLPMQQLSAQDEKTMLERIYSLSKNNLISVAQFSDNDDIDQYIVLLNKENKTIMVQKSWADGCLSSRILPGVPSVVGQLSGAFSIGLGGFAGITTYLASNLWNSYSLPADAVLLDIRSYSAMIKDFYKNALQNPETLNVYMNRNTRKKDWINMVLEYSQSIKMAHILGGADKESTNEKNQAIIGLGLTAPVIAIAGAAFSFISIISLIRSYQMKNANIATSERLQEQYDRNQAIIAQLKQIQYNANHS